MEGFWYRAGVLSPSSTGDSCPLAEESPLQYIHPHHQRSFGVAIFMALAFVLLAGVVMASPARAASLKEEREKASKLAAEVVALDGRIDASVADFAKATEALDAARERIERNDRLQRRTRVELEKARKVLAACAEDLYKRKGVSGLDILFSSADFKDLLDQISMERRIVKTRSDAMDTVKEATQLLEKREAELVAEREEAEALVARRGERLEAIRSELAERRDLLKGARTRVRKLTAQQLKAKKAAAQKPAPGTSPSPSAPASDPTPGPGPDPGGGQGAWWPLIQSAASSRGVNARGMYRLMMIESGGSATVVGPGGYYGLFQYAPSTWRGSWNPYRGSSITNGAAQIKATALAISKGYGPQWWTTSYAWAFGGT